MKSILTILNGSILAIAAYLVFFYGLSLQAIHFVVFGMALGSIHGQQKRSFHIITMLLNVGYILFGLFSIYAILHWGLPQGGSLTNTLVPIFVIFVAIPALNTRYVFNRIKKQ